jgi:hypothetical protein
MKRYVLSWPFARHIGSWPTAVYASKKSLLFPEQNNGKKRDRGISGSPDRR